MSIKSIVSELVMLAEIANLDDKLDILKKKWLDMSVQFTSAKKTENKEALWNLFIDTDPTKNKTYLQWILIKGISEWRNKSLKLFKEDLPKITNTLSTFEKLKQKNKLKPDHKDINKFKTFTGLFEALLEYNNENLDSKKDQKKNIEKEFYDKKEATLLHDSSDFKVVIPHSEKASCFFGINTQWCTAASSGSMFSSYNKRGNLYICLHKPTNKRWQLQFTNKRFECMDENDKVFDLEILRSENMDLLEKFRQVFSNIASKFFNNKTLPSIYLINKPTVEQLTTFGLSIKKPTMATLDFLIESLSDKNPKVLDKILTSNKKFAFLDKLKTGTVTSTAKVNAVLANDKLLGTVTLTDDEAIKILSKNYLVAASPKFMVTPEIWEYLLSLNLSQMGYLLSYTTLDGKSSLEQTIKANLNKFVKTYYAINKSKTFELNELLGFLTKFIPFEDVTNSVLKIDKNFSLKTLINDITYNLLADHTLDRAPKPIVDKIIELVRNNPSWVKSINNNVCAILLYYQYDKYSNDKQVLRSFVKQDYLEDLTIIGKINPDIFIKIDKAISGIKDKNEILKTVIMRLFEVIASYSKPSAIEDELVTAIKYFDKRYTLFRDVFDNSRFVTASGIMNKVEARKSELSELFAKAGLRFSKTVYKRTNRSILEDV